MSETTALTVPGRCDCGMPAEPIGLCVACVARLTEGASERLALLRIAYDRLQGHGAGVAACRERLSLRSFRAVGRRR